MFLLYLLIPLSVEELNTVKTLDSPIFNWYKVLEFWKGIFDKKTIWKFTFNSTAPDLKLLMSKGMEKAVGEKGSIQNKVNDIVNKLVEVNNNTETTKDSSNTKTNTGSLQLLADLPSMFNLPAFPSIYHQSSHPVLLEDDIAKDLNIDLSSFDFSEEETITLIRNIYTMLLATVPIFLFFVLGFIYYLFYCFCCCCPCCHRKEHKKPHIVLTIFFLISLLLILIGYVFTMISFQPFEHIKTTIATLPQQFDESIESLSKSTLTVTEQFSTKFDSVISQTLSAIKTLAALPPKIKKDIRVNVNKLFNNINNEEKDKNGEIKGIYPYTIGTIKDTATAIRQESDQFQKNYDTNFMNNYKKAFETEMNDGNDPFSQISKTLADLEDQTQSLNSVADFSDTLNSLDESLESLDQFTDFFDQISDILHDLKDFLNLSNMDVGGEPFSQKITNLKNSSSVVDLKKSITNVNSAIDDYFIFAKIGYLFLWSLNLFLVIGFLGSFFCYNCCAGCVAACAECYPCVCSIFLFLFGLFSTLLCTLLVFFGKELAPSIDSGVQAGANKAIPDGKLTFPAIDLSTKLNKTIRPCQLHPWDFTNLTFIQTALYAKLDTGLADFLSLTKIINFPELKQDLSTFVDNLHEDYGIEQTLKDKVKNVTDSIEGENDVLPDNFEDFYKKYFVSKNDEGQEESVWQKFYNSCTDLEKYYKDTVYGICTFNYIQGSGYSKPECCPEGDTETEYDSSKCQDRDKNPDHKKFHDICDYRRTVYMQADEDTYKGKLEGKYDGIATDKKNVADPLKKTLISEVEKAVGEVIEIFKTFINTFIADFAGTLNTIKADPIINAMALIFNILFYEMAFWTTTISMGSTLIIFGFIFAVIFMCCRRRGMLKEDPHKNDYSDYSDTSKSADFSKKKTRSTSTSSSSTYSSDSSRGNKKNKNANIRV